MNFPNYLVQVNIYLIIYFAFYRVFLSRETFFSFNRWFLMGALLTTLLLPFLKIDRLATAASHYPAQQLIVVLNEVTIRPAEAAWWIPERWNLFNVLAMVYLAGVVISGLILLKGLLHIYRMIRKNTGYRGNGYRHIVLKDDTTAFSFWHFLFAGSQTDRQILLHEMAHIRQKHSFDVLFLEIVKALCWFNPIIYLYKRNLVTVHEFLADEAATREWSKYEYASLLLNRSFGVQGNLLSNPFFRPSILKQRLLMLQRSRSRKAAIWKYTLSVPVIAALIFLSSTTFALRNKVSSGLQQIQSVKLENIPGAVQSEGLALHNDNGKENSMADTAAPLLNTSTGSRSIITVKGRVMDENGGAVPGATIFDQGTHNGISSDDHGNYILSNIPFNAILHVMKLGFAARSIAVEGNTTINILLHHSTIKMNELVVTSRAPVPHSPNPVRATDIKPDTVFPKIFTWVDNMPKYPGSLNEQDSQRKIMKYLHDHIQYPVAARDNGIQGTVYVQFIVSPEGYLYNIKSVNTKKLGNGLEEEAVRVISEMPRWIPGKQNGRPVTAQFSIPVRFVLQ